MGYRLPLDSRLLALSANLQQRRAIGVSATVPAPLAGQLLEGGDDQIIVPRQLVRRQAVASILAATAVTDHVQPQCTCAAW